MVICEDSLQNSPHAEGELNGSEIRRAHDLLPFIERDDFVFTRRFLKMLLRTPAEELAPLVKKLPQVLVQEIVRGIIDTDSELQNIFPEECAILLGTQPK